MSTQHTSGPWKVLADPIKAGRSTFHDFRYIATADSVVDYSDVDALSTDEQNEKEWTLESGELICSMRDCIGTQEANARLIAAAPDLLKALKEFTLRFEALEEKEAKGQKLNWREITANGAYYSAKRAIAKATGGTP